MKSYGINYMGSKNTIAEDIVTHIGSHHPDKKYFIDACCGGFAISHCVLANTRFELIANDLNPYMMGLYNEVLKEEFFTDEVSEEDFLSIWINREDYIDIQDNPSKYKPWEVGYVLSLWSFGGRGNSYLYAEDKMAIKKSLHYAIFDNEWDDSLKEFYLKWVPDHLKVKTKYTPARRKAILLAYKNYSGEPMQLEHATRAERFMEMIKDIRKRQPNILSTSDYKLFIESLPKEILDNAVIYIDPPYEGTAGYYTNDIDHQQFWLFVSSLKDKVPIYVSSYTAPAYIGEVWCQNKVVNMNNVSNSDKKNERFTMLERLFYNGYENRERTFYDLFR